MLAHWIENEVIKHQQSIDHGRLLVLAEDEQVVNTNIACLALHTTLACQYLTKVSLVPVAMSFFSVFPSQQMLVICLLSNICFFTKEETCTLKDELQSN